MRTGTIHLALHASLPQAPFRLVQAVVGWPDATRSEGWGRDENLALASRKALAEAVERAAWRRLPASAFRAAPKDVPHAWPTATLLGYTAAQYRRPGFPFPRVRAEHTRWWLPAQDVLGDQPRAVLADAVCHPLAFAADQRSQLLTWATSSGCASGARIEDAVLRATLELVERDAFMRHWFAQSPGLGLRLATLPRAAEARLQRLRAAGCDVGLQCLTRGLHPVWLAWAQHPRLHFSCLGAACGLQAEEALDRALAELETQAWARLAGVPAVRVSVRKLRSPADHAALYATARWFRRADPVLRAAPLADFGALAPGFQCSPHALQQHLREAGHPACWVDLSLAAAADILEGAPLFSVRVLAPGLIPIAFGRGLSHLGLARTPVAPGGRAPTPSPENPHGPPLAL